jgi:diguanylate cyclase (GGDEF)-like protein
MVGDGKSGEYRSTEAAAPEPERRGSKDRRAGSNRREREQPVPVERRIGFDRRTYRERRAAVERRNAVIMTATGVVLPGALGEADAPPFLDRLRDVVRVDVTEAEAQRHWRAIARNRENLLHGVGRDVGLEVAALDYFLNINPRLVGPAILERTALEEIERAAMVDVLTGLYNRRFLDAALAREVERCRRHHLGLSVLMFDLDNFKALNDRCGHDAGDVALQTLGELIGRRLRAVDIPCRYGGDEFAVVLPDTDRTHAADIGQRICADVARYFVDRRVAGCRLALTVSAGAADFGGERPSVETLLQGADRALYAAKAAGGNQVALAP